MSVSALDLFANLDDTIIILNFLDTKVESSTIK
ncbi:uncharacterized protein METZ01_LOCUS139084 [marine metagenome]|uniref:Uncharacterized protein n=1 Tax=marine metagenome TaxID=408172 RepID=A0A381ZAI5_9ZZZZ